MKHGIVILLQFMVIAICGQVHPNPFAAGSETGAATSYQNPVIPGFYSDPSMCRVGEDYYLVTSTFEYFPGVPVFHSRDLVHWEQIGHCIDRPGQMPEGINIFAATIRYHEGSFYMITTNVGRGGNFYLTASDPAGPWSDPVWIDIPEIDPDLFFDTDGKTYVISSPFILYEIDPATGELLTEGKKVWHGTGGRYAEGSHIYKKDGYYYLLASEGGTEEAHSVTIARSNTIWGPYTDHRANPILAHANAAGQNLQIQGVGHADMVKAHDGSWWMVCHGYRKVVPYPVHHILGRETCLVPVTWPKNGWPVVNGNGTVPVNMKCPTLPLHPFTSKPARDEFEDLELGLEWNFIQVPDDPSSFLMLDEGSLKLTGLSQQIGEGGTPAFVGRRLQHMDFSATTRLRFDPENSNEEAGLTLVNNGQHFDILVTRSGDERVAYVRLQFGSVVYRSEEVGLEDGPVLLRISGQEGEFVFSFSQDSVLREIQRVDARYLSTETVGWFTGVYVGMYATGNGKISSKTAQYEYFTYEPFE